MVKNDQIILALKSSLPENMADYNESYVLNRVKQGDISALEVIYHRHYANLCRYLLVLFRNPVMAEQIANDVFIYLWENRQSIEIKSSLESYLFAAGRYKTLNKIRDSKRQKEISHQLSLASDDSVEGPDSIIEIKELENIIEKAIETLPPRCQQIFRLSREEEMSYKEIAALLDISVNTVEGQMSIALSKLRAILRPYYCLLLINL